MRAFLDIAKARWQAGDQEAARTAFGEARARVKDSTILWYDGVQMGAGPLYIQEAIAAQSEAGDVKGAREWAEKQESPFSRSIALAAVAEGSVRLPRQQEPRAQKK
jgi:hypothetical protein